MVNNNNQNNYNQSQVNDVYGISKGADTSRIPGLNDASARSARRSNNTRSNSRNYSNNRRSSNYQRNNRSGNKHIFSHATASDIYVKPNTGSNIGLSTTNARAIFHKLMVNTKNANLDNRYVNDLFTKVSFDKNGNAHLKNLSHNEVQVVGICTNKVRMDIGQSLDHFENMYSNGVGSPNYDQNRIHYYRSRYASIKTLNDSLSQNGVGDERNNNGFYRPNPNRQYKNNYSYNRQNRQPRYNNRPKYQSRPQQPRTNQQLNMNQNNPQPVNSSSRQSQQNNQQYQQSQPNVQNQQPQQPAPNVNSNQRVENSQPQNNGTSQRQQRSDNMQNQHPTRPAPSGDVGHSFSRNSKSKRSVQSNIKRKPAFQQQKPSKQEIRTKKIRNSRGIGDGDASIPF